MNLPQIKAHNQHIYFINNKQFVDEVGMLTGASIKVMDTPISHDGPITLPYHPATAFVMDVKYFECAPSIDNGLFVLEAIRHILISEAHLFTTLFLHTMEMIGTTVKVTCGLYLEPPSKCDGPFEN